MSNKFDWDDEDQGFRDIPDEVHERPAPPAALPPAQQLANRPQENPPEYGDGDEGDYIQDESMEDDDFDYSSVLTDARLRLEQGRLYEMIMNHDIFGGVDADPRAMKTVQNQIRRFAKEQMEIMLGMRQPVSDSLGVDLPFNSLEVEALRALASAATKGASQDPDVEKYVAPVEPRRSGLNQIGARRPVTQKPVSRRDNRPLPKRAQEPMRRVKVDPNIEAELRERGIEKEYIEEAKRQVAQESYKPLTKDPSQMTPEELRQRNAEAARRQGHQVKSPQALPMATPEQQEAMAMARASQAAAHPSMVKIMDLLNKPTRN